MSGHQHQYYMGHGRDQMQRGRPSNAHAPMGRAPPGMAGGMGGMGVGGMGQMGNARYGVHTGAGMRGGPAPSAAAAAPSGGMPHGAMGAPRGGPRSAGAMPAGYVMGARNAPPGVGADGMMSSSAGRAGGAPGAGAAPARLGFDMNDFPSLGGSQGSGTNSGTYRNVTAGGSGAGEPQTFAMSSADFPALPGSRAPADAGRRGPARADGARASSGGRGGGAPGAVSGFASAVAAAPKAKRSDASGGMQQFGLLGLLHVIRMTDADLNTLALGLDLTTLGLNLNSPECLYATFASPWVDTPTSKDPQFTLPQCYNMQPPALKTGHLSEFALETLFYIFYAMPRDSLQAYAAQELYKREWRYHRELRLWFAKYPAGAEPAGGPKPQYLYFDINGWAKRAFTGSVPGLQAGFLSPADVQVKLA